MIEMKKGEWIERRSWKEFRSYGLLWMVNCMLHMFGWAIAVELNEKKEITNAYPCRVKYRGFDRKNNDKGYRSLANYMAKSGEILLEDFNENEENK